MAASIRFDMKYRPMAEGTHDPKLEAGTSALSVVIYRPRLRARNGGGSYQMHPITLTCATGTPMEPCTDCRTLARRR